MELNELNPFLLLVSKKCVIVKVPIADDVRSDFFSKIRFSGTGRTSENQIFWFNQHRRKRISVSLELLNKLFLNSSFRFCRCGFLLIFFAVCQNELISRFTETLQTFLNEDNRREDIPAIDNKLPSVVIAVCQVLYCVAAILEIVNTRINTSDYVAARVIFADREVLLVLNR